MLLNTLLLYCAMMSCSNLVGSWQENSEWRLQLDTNQLPNQMHVALDHADEACRLFSDATDLHEQSCTVRGPSRAHEVYYVCEPQLVLLHADVLQAFESNPR